MNKSLALLFKSVKCSQMQRTISSSKISLNKDKQFVPIYKFPYIRGVALINSVKLIQTSITAISIPGSIILNQLNYLPVDYIYFVGGLGLSGCLALYSLGYWTNKFVGFIYYNEEKDVAKISYADFWGQRKDLELQVKDIVPLSDLPVSATDGLFLKLKQFSTEDTFKINLQFGVILDKDKFKKVL